MSSAPTPARAAGQTKEEAEISYQQVLRLSEQERMVARRFYAPAFFVLSCLWLVMISVLLFLHGFGIMRLSDSVLIAALSTTTANVLGTLFVVARYLFPGGK